MKKSAAATALPKSIVRIRVQVEKGKNFFPESNTRGKVEGVIDGKNVFIFVDTSGWDPVQLEREIRKTQKRMLLQLGVQGSN